jgi:hypothetical protein
MGVQTKNAGGRNLAGQRASSNASKLTRHRDGAQIASDRPKGKGAGHVRPISAFVPGERRALLLDKGPARKLAPVNGRVKILVVKGGQGALGGAFLHFGGLGKTF